MNFKRFWGDAYSITSYRETMGRLQRLGDKEPEDRPSAPPPHVRVVSLPPTDTAERYGRPVTLPARGRQTSATIRQLRDQRESNRGPNDQAGAPRLVFIDDSVADLSVVAEPTGPSDQRPKLRTLAAALGLTALVGGGTALLLLELHHGAAATNRPAASVPRPAAAGTPQPSLPAGASPRLPGPAATTPPATSPPPGSGPTVLASSIGPTSATYSVAGGTIDLEVTASAPCWIDVRPIPNGASIFTGTLTPGERRAFSGAGSLSIRVGFPNGLRVVANGTGIPLPADSQPYNLVFNQTSQTRSQGQ